MLLLNQDLIETKGTIIVFPNIPYGVPHTLQEAKQCLATLAELEDIAEGTFLANIHYSYINARRDYFYHLGTCNHDIPYNKNHTDFCTDCTLANLDIRDLYNKDLGTVNIDQHTNEEWDA